ncbi:hypothetical protein GY45DRAFT_601931 [Cubamyces sp. BRFM 1775]|nr:hypothetical protein GY45DRAFT_601931 [Cubamyces sp. BRFM 1775]
MRHMDTTTPLTSPVLHCSAPGVPQYSAGCRSGGTVTQPVLTSSLPIVYPDYSPPLGTGLGSAPPTTGACDPDTQRRGQSFTSCARRSYNPGSPSRRSHACGSLCGRQRRGLAPPSYVLRHRSLYATYTASELLPPSRACVSYPKNSLRGGARLLVAEVQLNRA